MIAIVVGSLMADAAACECDSVENDRMIATTATGLRCIDSLPVWQWLFQLKRFGHSRQQLWIVKLNSGHWAKVPYQIGNVASLDENCNCLFSATLPFRPKPAQGNRNPRVDKRLRG